LKDEEEKRTVKAVVVEENVVEVKKALLSYLSIIDATSVIKREQSWKLLHNE